MAVSRIQENIKQKDGTYVTIHKETEARLVLFDDGDTFQDKYDAGELKGATGTQGATGAAAGFGTPKATVDANTGTPSVTVTATGANTAKVFSFAFKNLKGATGATGSQGPKGATGSTGQRGSQWLTGTLLSGTSTTTDAYSSSSMPASLVGDMYLNTSYGYVYQCTTAGTGSAAKWTYKGSIKGATGDPGTTTWEGITGKPDAFPPASHSHAASAISAGTFAATGVKAMSGTDYSTARVRNIRAGTSDLTPGSSALTSGDIYLVYE